MSNNQTLQRLNNLRSRTLNDTADLTQRLLTASKTLSSKSKVITESSGWLNGYNRLQTQYNHALNSVQSTHPSLVTYQSSSSPLPKSMTFRSSLLSSNAEAGEEVLESWKIYLQNWGCVDLNPSNLVQHCSNLIMKFSFETCNLPYIDFSQLAKLDSYLAKSLRQQLTEGFETIENEKIRKYNSVSSYFRSILNNLQNQCSELFQSNNQSNYDMFLTQSQGESTKTKVQSADPLKFYQTLAHSGIKTNIICVRLAEYFAVSSSCAESFIEYTGVRQRFNSALKGIEKNCFDKKVSLIKELKKLVEQCVAEVERRRDQKEIRRKFECLKRGWAKILTTMRRDHDEVERELDDFSAKILRDLITRESNLQYFFNLSNFITKGILLFHNHELKLFKINKNKEERKEKQQWLSEKKENYKKLRQRAEYRSKLYSQKLKTLEEKRLNLKLQNQRQQQLLCDLVAGVAPTVSPDRTRVQSKTESFILRLEDQNRDHQNFTIGLTDADLFKDRRVLLLTSFIEAGLNYNNTAKKAVVKAPSKSLPRVDTFRTEELERLVKNFKD
ncbi:hypothetical protein P9112_014377 [Eukaryota sp. TZLM1-RC]